MYTTSSTRLGHFGSKSGEFDLRANPCGTNRNFHRFLVKFRFKRFYSSPFISALGPGTSTPRPPKPDFTPWNRNQAPNLYSRPQMSASDIVENHPTRFFVKFYALNVYCRQISPTLAPYTTTARRARVHFAPFWA